MSIEKVGSNKCFGGDQLQYTHDSAVLSCNMRFSIFLPPQAAEGKVPVIYWLSGLTLSLLTPARAGKMCLMILTAPMTLASAPDSM